MYISAFKLMWVMVLFDLPVLTKKEKKTAAKFRSDLMDLGFTMCQFSVYMKFANGLGRANRVIDGVKKISPIHGNIQILKLTDKQVANAIILGSQVKRKETARQLSLF